MATRTKSRPANFKLPRKAPKRSATGNKGADPDKQIITQVLRWISNADDADRLLLATRLGRGLSKLPPCDAVQMLLKTKIITESKIFVGDVTKAHASGCDRDVACPTCDTVTGAPSNNTHVCCTRVRALDVFKVVYSP